MVAEGRASSSQEVKEMDHFLPHLPRRPTLKIHHQITFGMWIINVIGLIKDWVETQTSKKGVGFFVWFGFVFAFNYF